MINDKPIMIIKMEVTMPKTFWKISVFSLFFTGIFEIIFRDFIIVIPIKEIVIAIPIEKKITLIKPKKNTSKYKLKRMIAIEIGQGTNPEKIPNNIPLSPFEIL